MSSYYVSSTAEHLPTVIMSSCFVSSTAVHLPAVITSPYFLSLSNTYPNCHHFIMLSLSQQHNPLQLSSCHHVVLASATQPPSNCHHVTMLYLFQQNNLLPIAIVSLCYFCNCLSNTTLFQLSSRHHAVFVSAAQPPSNCHHTVFVTFIQPPSFAISSSHRLCHNYTTPSICHLVIAPSLSQQHNPFHLSSRHNAVPTTQSAFYSHPVKIRQTSCSP